jgi:hypothetical protein
LVRFSHGDPTAVIRDVLAQAAYRHVPATVAGPLQKSLLEIVFEWISDHIIKPLSAPIGRALGAGRGIGTVLGIVTIAIAVLVLAYLAYRLAMRFARPPLVRDAVRESPLEGTYGAADWVAFARAAAARGDFAEAIAALFTAALATLDAAEIVRFDAARTPGEYRRIVRRERVFAADAFDELAQSFVRARFAPQPADAAAFGIASSAFERFEPNARAS